MWFSQNNRIPDLEWDYFAVLWAVLGAVFASIGRHGVSYLAAAISARRSSTARRAAASKSALDCEA